MINDSSAFDTGPGRADSTAGERLTHEAAMDCIFGALTVTILGYEEAIHAYMRLRDIGDWREREDRHIPSGTAEIRRRSQ